MNDSQGSCQTLPLDGGGTCALLQAMALGNLFPKKIRREMGIQRLLTAELIQEVRQHIQVMENLAVKDDYRDPYFSGCPLPSSWLKTHSDLLNSHEALSALTAAEKASAKLQDAFSKLLTGGSSGAEWEPALIEMLIALDDAAPTSE